MYRLVWVIVLVLKEGREIVVKSVDVIPQCYGCPRMSAGGCLCFFKAKYVTPEKKIKIASIGIKRVGEGGSFPRDVTESFKHLHPGTKLMHYCRLLLLKL